MPSLSRFTLYVLVCDLSFQAYAEPRCQSTWIDLSKSRLPLELDGFWDQLSDRDRSAATLVSRPAEHKIIAGYPIAPFAREGFEAETHSILRLRFYGLEPREEGYQIAWASSVKPKALALVGNEPLISWQKPEASPQRFYPTDRGQVWTLLLLWHQSQREWREAWLAPRLQRGYSENKLSLDRGSLWAWILNFTQRQGSQVAKRCQTLNSVSEPLAQDSSEWGYSGL